MNVERFRPTIKKLFAQFYANEINKRQLIQGLREVEYKLFEQDVKMELSKQLWLRFFNGDTMATTIEDLCNDISSSTNHDYIMDKIKIALEKPKGFQIKYS